MITINILGLLLIALIVWWFWLYREKTIEISDGEIRIVVENGTYEPAKIKLKAGQPISIQFLRKDASPCAGTVLLPALEISQELPLNKSVSIKLPELKKGEYPFHCQMQMYKGAFIVE